MTDPHSSEKSIFLAALEKESAQERAAFLDQACAGDPRLRAEVEALLAAHERLGELPPAPGATGAGTTVEEPALTEGPGTWIGPYKLLQKLGEGGMGTVYLGEQQEPVKRQVALKIIKAGMDSAHVIGRFEQERQALAVMDHPNIAKVFDAGTTEEKDEGGRMKDEKATHKDSDSSFIPHPSSFRIGRPYFVMELVKGIPITKFCDQEQLTPRQRLELLVPVCQAVQHAHQKGIIHRDLKPSNVLIALYDGKPVPKVIDFGVAKATGQKLTERTLFTEVGQMVGTLEYMAPEQAELNNLDIDTRADIYALGVILYELLTGSPPFTGQQLRSAAFAEMLRIIREVEPPKPSTRLSTSEELPSIAAKHKLEPKKLTRQVQGELDWIVMKCLEKERQRRYETANGLAMDLQRYLADEPVAAGPPSAGYRLRKFMRRNKGRVLAAVVIFLALVGGIIGTSVGMVQARRSAKAERLVKDVAEQRLKQIEKANEILASIFRDLNPKAEEKGGPDLRVRLGERLEEAARLLEGVAVGDALVVAGLQNLFGSSLRELGHYEQAQPLLEKARQTREDRLGADHPETLDTKNNLAQLYYDQGKYERAEPLWQEALEASTARLGAEHHNTLVSKLNLATLYVAQGKYDRAETLFQEGLQALTAELGADHPETLACKHNLAALYKDQGKHDQAETLLREVVQGLTAKLGADHPNTLNSKNSLAELYRVQGKYDRAETLLHELVQVAATKLGPDHPDTLIGKGNLADVYAAQRKYDRAEQLFQEVIQAQTAKLGAGNPDTLATKRNLAVMYADSGRLDRSIPLSEELVELHKKAFSPDHPLTLNAMAQLGFDYMTAGRLTEAVPLLEDAYQRARKHPRPWLENLMVIPTALAESYDRAGQFAKAEALCRDLVKEAGTLRMLEYLGRSLLRQKKYVEAEPVLRQCLQVYERKLPDDFMAFDVKSMLGASLLGQQKHAEAEPPLVQGYDGMKQRETKMPSLWAKGRLAEAVERLVQLYDAWGKKDEAQKWRATAEALKTTKDTKNP
jgi:serine/threonine protein kinase/lipopolysaccharide biosynthesis regulator YciM